MYVPDLYGPETAATTADGPQPQGLDEQSLADG
jgi:hypothetical protein